MIIFLKPRYWIFTREKRLSSNYELRYINKTSDKMKKTYWVILIVVIAFLGAGAWFLSGKKKEAVFEWRTAKVELGDLKIVVTATGTLNAVKTIQVGTQVSGIVSRILVDFNSVVRQGEVIALIDTTNLAQAVEDASANMQRAEIQVNQTKREFDRNKVLFDQKVIAQADYDLSLSAYETAVANARSSKAALNRAKINLQYATIYAPISGVVVSRNVDVGQTVAASFNTPTLFTIANDLTKMQVQANVDEADVGKVQVGQDVSFTVDAYDNMTFSGTVSQIRLQPIVVQNVVNYTVIIDVPNPDMKLLPGMTANCTINIKEEKDILKVPASALTFKPPQEFLDKMMKGLPDSLKKKKEKWMQGRSGNQQEQGAGRPSGSMEGSRGSGGMDMGGEQNRQGHETRGGRANSGMIWIKNGDTLTPRRIRTGISDGTYTEVIGKIAEGDEVVIGQINKQQTGQSNKQQNPFAPQMPGRGGR